MQRGLITIGLDGAVVSCSPESLRFDRTWLSVAGVSFSAEGVRSLHGFEGLVELDLRYNEIGAEGVRALLAAPFIGSLRRLLLYRGDVGDDGVKMLANAPQLPSALRSFWRSV